MRIYIYIYNIETKEKNKITNLQLSALFGGLSIAAIGKPLFIDNLHVYSGFVNNSGYIRYSFSWNISENKINNYIDFNGSESLDVRDSLLLFCNAGGLLGLAKNNFVSVPKNIQETYSSLSFKNNILVYFTDKAFTGEYSISDILGKYVLNPTIQYFSIGENIITINQPFLKGVYILTIRDKTSQNSYKFIVE